MATACYDHSGFDRKYFKTAINNVRALGYCDFCDKEDARLRCDGCHEALYCSEKCQKRDRPQHEMLCASARDHFNRDSGRPPNHIRGIIFPIDATAPSFVWLSKENWPLSVAQVLVDDEKRNYAGRIFSVTRVEHFTEKHVWATVPNSGTLYVSNKDGAPIHPDHVLAFYDFAESQLKQLSEQQLCIGSMSFPRYEKLEIAQDELKKWFTRERFETFWSKWVWQPERACKYDHNDGGIAWYPGQPLIKSQIVAWHPYAFVGRSWLEPSSDSVFGPLRMSFLRLSMSFRL
ncbi:hypothetical protein Hte_011749 [Hypoxylon texense]